MEANLYITLDGHKYAVAKGTYVRTWIREFSAGVTAAATIILNFVDKGPGIRTYSMQLMLVDWAPSSDVYKAIYGTDPAIASMNTQRQNLETSYGKIASSLSFIDPFGETPSGNGVYFTNMTEIIPDYSTTQKPYLLMTVEFKDSTVGAI